MNGEAVNTYTGNAPCAIHVPGKNWPAYNNIGRQLVLHDFEYVPSPTLNWLGDSIKSAEPYWKQNTVNIMFILAALILMGTLVCLSIFTYPDWWQEYMEEKQAR